jgi:hypothetical protein
MRNLSDEPLCHVHRTYDNGWVIGYENNRYGPDVVVVHTPYYLVHFRPFEIFDRVEDPDLNDEDENWVFSSHSYHGASFCDNPLEPLSVTFVCSIPKPRNKESALAQMIVQTSDSFQVLKGVPEPYELFEETFMDLWNWVWNHQP